VPSRKCSYNINTITDPIIVDLGRVSIDQLVLQIYYTIISSTAATPARMAVDPSSFKMEIPFVK
jgi:hypothetical protein